MPRPLRIASVNVNGVRAAYRNGMGPWLDARDVDILCLQEVRAETDDVTGLLGPDWNVLHDAATAKGRAGVAIASRKEADLHRVDFGAPDFDSAGRWLEADFDVDGTVVTVVSVYVHSGEDGTPKQLEKYKFLDALVARLPELRKHNPLAVIMGDLNVGHRTLDIKNWKGNVKRAGFLPKEREYFDRILAPRMTRNTTPAPVSAGSIWAVGSPARFPGPYTWWSSRGQAFDTDTGWRIDYQLATPELAALARTYTVDRAASYSERWSDHAPVVVDYDI